MNKAIFLDRDGVINVEKNFVLSPEEMELIKEAPHAISLINKSDYLAVLVTNQSAVARNLITLKELSMIHNKLKADLKKGGASLNAIYFCPHHPNYDPSKGNPELIRECTCRKPKPGMLYAAAEDLNIDLKQSFLIGDSERDILAAKAAGCKTVGVRTGKNIDNFSVVPDHVFENILEATQFILSKDKD